MKRARLEALPRGGWSWTRGARVNAGSSLHQSTVRTLGVTLDELSGQRSRFRHAVEVDQQRDSHGTPRFRQTSHRRVPLFTFFSEDERCRLVGVVELRQHPRVLVFGRRGIGNRDCRCGQDLSHCWVRYCGRRSAWRRTRRSRGQRRIGRRDEPRRACVRGLAPQQQPEHPTREHCAEQQTADTGGRLRQNVASQPLLSATALTSGRLPGPAV